MKKSLADLQARDHIRDQLAAVQSVSNRQAANGNGYRDLVLVDKSGSIKAKIWADAFPMCEECQAGDIVNVNGVVDEYRDERQFSIKSLEIVPKEKAELSDFIESYDGDLNVLFSQINGYIKSVKNKHLKTLLSELFNQTELKKKFKLYPGAQFVHHAFLGGLMKHLYEMLQLMDKVCEIYPEVNRDLLICGVLFHDLGKIDELDVSTTIGRTSRGKMIGHISLGMFRIENAINKIKKFPNELREQLHHLIISHHGQKEFGSPVLPMTLEAMLLHYLDQISSKANIFIKRINAGTPGTFTEKINLLQTEIYIPSNEENVENDDEEEEATLF